MLRSRLDETIENLTEKLNELKNQLEGGQSRKVMEIWGGKANNLI